MTHLMIAGGIYLLLLALIIMIQSWRAQALIFTQVFKAIPFRDGFSIAP